MNMRQSDSNCRMQGRCVFGGICSTAFLGESNHCLGREQSSLQNARKICFWRDSLSRKQYADLCEVGDRTILRSRVRRYGKHVGFSWPVHSSLASSVPLDIA